MNVRILLEERMRRKYCLWIPVGDANTAVLFSFLTKWHILALVPPEEFHVCESSLYDSRHRVYLFLQI